MIQSIASGETPEFSRTSLAAFAANVTSDSSASACASEMIPARRRSLPVGMPKAASTSSDGMVLEPKATPENRNRAELGRVDMKSLRPFLGLRIVGPGVVGPWHCERLKELQQERRPSNSVTFSDLTRFFRNSRYPRP